jgi:hypothetical protein
MQICIEGDYSRLNSLQINKKICRNYPLVEPGNEQKPLNKYTTTNSKAITTPISGQKHIYCDEAHETHKITLFQDTTGK